jgi:tRNA-specific 2-thiouridylase
MKAIVAMSGGVDSSVAAYLLKKQGLEVIGLSFELWDRRDVKRLNVCCSIETIEIAKEVARKLGIDHYTVDVRDDFYRYIIEDFCASYISGITPNPCILCNKFIKFKFLLKKAEEIGADLVSTGHYARVIKSSEFGVQSSEFKDKDSLLVTRYLLLKGIDPKKDQSYVLYVMTQRELSKTVFPLGELKKDETRSIAMELGLVGAIRPESQEICFVGNGSYVDFIKDFSSGTLKPGPIINMEGKIIGEHKGIAFYTIGQRKRLGISTLRPCYVVDVDIRRNTLIVGAKEDAMKKVFKVRELNWISIELLRVPLRAKAKIRSTMKEEPAIIIPDKNQSVIVEFEKPQWAPAKGQSAVFYDGESVIGGGVIE